jgi:3-mercaptopyruvate sulfurtransferase SseA/uncharacterized membrane protein YedE/YeeE
MALMNTLYSLGELNTHIGLMLALAIGFFFGWFLEKAGFGSSRRMAGIFYFRDMAVLKVMFTAVVTALLGYRYLLAMGWLRQDAMYLLDTYWGAQVVGGLLFGVGFVMGGWCPGTAFVGLASAKWDALVFLLGAAIGSILFNEVFELVQPLYESGHDGVLFLPESLRMSWRIFPLLFCAIAVGAFAGSTWLERRFGEATQKTTMSNPRNRAAAAVLLLAAAALLFVPVSAEDGTQSTNVAPGLLAEVADAADHIEPETLAGQLMAGGSGLMVVDIRGPREYTGFHIRGAINVPLAQLQGAAASFPGDKTVVLYSNGTTHAAQAWLMMRQWGWTNVFVLTDGLLGFWRHCLTPPSLLAAADPGRAREAGAAFRARRDFFVEAQGEPLPASAEPPSSAPGPLLAPGLRSHLVSTAWLAERLAAGELKVVDVRTKSKSYSTAHIPGAAYLNMENLRTTIDGYHSMLAPAGDIVSALGRLGISRKDTVIVYDDRLRDATLMAVALERVGHESFAVLHGGYPQWDKEGRPVTSAVPRVQGTLYEAREEAPFTVTVDDVHKALQAGKAAILDVRPEAYFTGEKSDEARSGHIPGAISRPYEADVVSDGAMWLDAAVLKGAYGRLGIGADTPVIVHCRTGHQASQTYFLLKHILGYKAVRWFDASWMAWAARSDLPLATGR